MTRTIYLSPHLDDVTLSCGGLVYEQVKRGDEVEIWTFTAGIPHEDNIPPLAMEMHNNWGIGVDAVAIRREEDLMACMILGAKARHLEWLDCIYRFRQSGEAFIQTNGELFEVEPEAELIQEIAEFLKASIPQEAQLVCPMGIGNHVDHRLIVKAVAAAGLQSLFYADYPYVTSSPEQIAQLETLLWQRIPSIISEEGLHAWQKAIAAYVSQLSTFWDNVIEVYLAISNYYAGGGGRLWKHISEPIG